jgi:hypothetical protein
MKQRATLLDIIEAGLWGEQERVLAYTELLIQRIEEEQDVPLFERERDSAALQWVIDRRKSGDRGHVISLAKEGELSQ